MRFAARALAAMLLVAGCSRSSTTPVDYSDQPAPPEVAELQLRRLLDRAQGALQQGQPAEAVLYLDDALRINGDDRTVLALTGAARIIRAAQQSGTRPDEARADVHKAIAALTHLKELPEPMSRQEMDLLAEAYILDARLLMVGKKADEAIARVQAASEAGFVAPETLDDPVFDPLRERSEFQKAREEIGARSRQRGQEFAAPILAENKPFPFQVELTDLEGDPFRLADLRGKVVIVDLWGTWCAPCRMEIPHFARLYETYRDQGLEIVGLNFENAPQRSQAEALIKEAMKELKVPYRCLLGTDRILEQVPQMEGFPTTLFLDRNGVVRARLTGARSYTELEGLVLSLLSESDVQSTAR